MSPADFTIHECSRPECGLRYPYVIDFEFGESCPRCRGETQIVEHQKRAPELINDPSETLDQKIELLIDNVRSVWNVGSIFRTAEGFGVSKIHLCGIAPTPDNIKLKKTALGSETQIPWQYYPNGVSACQELLSQGSYLIGLETTEKAVLVEKIQAPSLCRWVLIVGNENCGIDPGILPLCNQLTQIKMQGRKRSLNVAVSVGVALYQLRML
jgi:23S rRNA (guanosine2251-2'-O)-methyltransferase